MNAFKRQCVELRKKDMTLPEIMEATGRPKTSVWFHIQDIPLSEEKQKEIAKENVKRIAQYGTARKGKSVREFREFTKWNKELIYLVSHLLFDGQIYKASCIYHNRSKSLVKRVVDCMQLIYDYEPKKRIRENGVISIGYYNVALTNYLKAKSVELLENISKFPKEHKKAFLKAFFDDEGCMDFKGKRKRVRGYQNNKEILNIIKELLLDFGIESRMTKSYVHEVVITGKDNLVKFREEINFSPGVRINGKRRNSIWKKDLEKRKILEMAINSYKK